MMKVILTYVFDRKKVASKVKTGVVELKISSNGKRKYISTGVKLYPKEWSNGSVVGRKDWKEVNDQLQSIKKKCSEIINQMIEDGNLDIDSVPRLLTASIMQRQTFIEYMKELSKTRFLKLAAGTQKRYLVFFKFMEEWRGIVSFADITERNIIAIIDKPVNLVDDDTGQPPHHVNLYGKIKDLHFVTFFLSTFSECAMPSSTR